MGDGTTTVSGGWMRKNASGQPVSYWVRVLQEQVEREREEREAHEDDLELPPDE